MKRVSYHFQAIPGWAARHVAASGVKYVKVIDPPQADPFPGVKIVARFWRPDAETNALAGRGVLGAREYFDWLLPQMNARPWAWAFEAPNEPQPMASRAFRLALNAFTVELAHLMTKADKRLVGLNLGVGWPALGEAKDLVGAVRALNGGHHFVGLHEYAAPTMYDRVTWLCLRYRRTVNEWREAGAAMPRVLIGECGIDGGVIERDRTGWKSYTDEAGYAAQLDWYDSELQRDPYVVAATIFTAGPAGEWADFEVTEGLSARVFGVPAEAQEGGRPGRPERERPERDKPEGPRRRDST